MRAIFPSSRREFIAAMIHIGIYLSLPQQLRAQSPVDSTYRTSLREFTRDHAIFDSGAHLGQAIARVPLSGETDAPDGTVIETRAVSLDDGGATTTDWAEVATATGGVWFGILGVPRASSWYRAEARVQGSTMPAAQMTSRFAAGHVWAIWGQSNPQRLLHVEDEIKAQRGTVNRPGDMQVVKRTTVGSNTAKIFDIDNSLSEDISPALIDFANGFSAVRPGEKLRVLWHTQSGTSALDALTTPAEDTAYRAAGERDWNDELAIHALGTADGQQVGVVNREGWSVGIGNESISDNTHAQLFTGHDLDGNPTTPEAKGVPRFLAAQYGGLYDYRYTRYSTTSPAAGIDYGRETPAANVTSGGWYGTIDTGNGYNQRMMLLQKYGDSNNPEMLPWVGPDAGAWNGTTDRAHFDSGLDGRQRYASIMLHNLLQATGLASNPLPRLDYRYDDPDGVHADFGIVGFNLTTERLRRAAEGTLGNIPAIIPDLSVYGATVDPAEDHRTEVMGWAIDGRPARRAEIVRGAGPNGEDICRVYPNEGRFTYANSIVYGWAGETGHLVKEDFADRAYLNMLVVDMGQPRALLPALPVYLQGPFALPGTYEAPRAFTVAGGTAFADPNNLGPGTRSIRVEISGKVAPDSKRSGFATAHADNLQFSREPDGSLLLTSNNLLLSLQTDSGVMPYEVTKTVVAVIDLPNSRALIEVDGQRLAETGVVGGNFSGGRPFSFLQLWGAKNRAKGTFSSLKVWFNDAEGAGRPRKVIDGDADTANADPWKTGDDAA
jgi:hypothetical protein